MDIRAYAVKYQDQIDWDSIGAEIPLAASTLSLLHQVWPLPESLRKCLKLGPGSDLSGSKLDLRQWPTPWTSAMRQQGRLNFLRQLYFPSTWWLQLYHALGAGSAVWPYRWLLHPLHITRRIWLWRCGGDEE